MDLELRGKRVLVTGASRGIGRAIASLLAQEGCRVMVNSRSPEDLENTAKELGAIAFAADVTRPAECANMMKFLLGKWDGLDILVCNVGNGKSVPPGEETPEEWKRVLDLNLLAATNLVELATPALAKTSGSILCISSICGSEALGAPVTYSAAKAALNAFVTGVSRPLAKKNIRINALAPGNILFPGSTWEKKLRENPSEVEAMLAREVSLGRLGKAEEVASFAAFLVSPRAGFATGSVFRLDGGQLRGNG